MSEITHLICARCGGDNSVSNAQGQKTVQNSIVTSSIVPGMLHIALNCRHCGAIYPIVPMTSQMTWQEEAYCRLGRERDKMTPDAVRAVQDFLGPLHA